MDGGSLQDRINRGLGVAARATGVSCDVFRPSGPECPLAASNLFVRLVAAFNAQDPRFQIAASYGHATWYGVFDAAYTRSGDYLVESISGRTWFVAAQQALLPVLCVLTNRKACFERSAAPLAAGANTYGGATDATSAVVMADWPVSMLAAGTERRGPSDLPADPSLGGFFVLLPPVCEATLQAGDLMIDDLGRRCVVSVAELTQLGWRLTVRQTAT